MYIKYNETSVFQTGTTGDRNNGRGAKEEGWLNWYRYMNHNARFVQYPHSFFYSGFLYSVWMLLLPDVRLSKRLAMHSMMQKAFDSKVNPINRWLYPLSTSPPAPWMIFSLCQYPLVLFSFLYIYHYFFESWVHTHYLRVFTRWHHWLISIGTRTQWFISSNYLPKAFWRSWPAFRLIWSDIGNRFYWFGGGEGG